MNFNRIISAALACVIAAGTLAVLPRKVSADEVTVTEGTALTTTIVTAQSAGKLKENGDPILNYTSSTTDKTTTDEDGNIIDNPAWASFEDRMDKIASMMLVSTIGDIEVYYEAFTGEVAFRNVKTTDILFTNPYDVAAGYSNSIKGGNDDSPKAQLLSQIVLTYEDNGEEKTFYSYQEAALRKQIIMKPIKNGIRVEYQIGEPAIQRLTPRMISVKRMKELILEPMQEMLKNIEKNPDEYKDIIAAFGTYSDLRKATDTFISYYALKDPTLPGQSEREVKDMTTLFPICKSFPIYVCDTATSAAELKRLEKVVKFLCPKYTYEELDTDNQQTGYKNTDQSPPRFTMALEYVVDAETGAIDVTLPANGISFDETLYQLKNVTILPYMGTGNNRFNGYTFYPDGSGTIFRYDEMAEGEVSIKGNVYGADYAYHEITGQNTQPLRFPVFGSVTNYTDPVDPNHKSKYTSYNDAGFLAIITEGDSLATLFNEHRAVDTYNSVYAKFTPRPSDKYSLGTAGSNESTSWTVTSKRRYTDNYTIKYIMLSDHEEAKYEASYIGMAEAYRNYLTDNEFISKIDDAKDDIPLYIESFGSMKGTDRVLSFPVEIDIPLTTFDDIKKMKEELAKDDAENGIEGITNVSFKLTGFANGGLESTAPYKLEWQEVLGGKDGMADLVKYAEKENIGIYPDFDFAYVDKTENFDGVSLKKQAVKTIDGRYTRKQVYDSGYQEFQPVGGAAISASTFSYFWNEFSGNYEKYNLKAISLSTLGSDLNSDFDEKDPHHREDSKQYTMDLLETAGNKDSVMVSGGNAYVIPYADVITDMPLTSSEFISASQTVPFVGLVLHGSKNFTGSPLNMEGDMDEAVLNAIENGASPFFTLSYQNTQELKVDKYWSKYYSIAYDIWQDDVKEYYGILNNALGDLQDQYIVDHEFVPTTDAKRVATEDEKVADEAYRAEMDAANAAFAAEAKERYDLAVKRSERLDNVDLDSIIMDLGDELGASLDPATGEWKSNFYNAQEEIDKQYFTETGTVIRVTYENGVQFILNYNSFDVEVAGVEEPIGAMSFVRIENN